jgi:hypothetical protein
MRKKLLILIIPFYTIAANCQDTIKHNFGIGFGMIQSKVNGSYTVPLLVDDVKYSFDIGVSYQININKYFGLGSNINYINIGCGYKDLPGDAVNDFNRYKVDLQSDLKYINWPIYLFINPLGCRYLKLDLGFYSSRLISARFSKDLEGYSYAYRVPINDASIYSINKWDFGLLCGIGSELPLNKNLFVTIDIKYNYGLTKINQERFLTNITDPYWFISFPKSDTRFNNSYFIFNIGLMYKLK